MTAVNVIVRADCVHVITDGAATDSRGRLVHLMQKATPLPHLRSVIAIRGNRALSSCIVDAVSTGGSSFDDIRRNLVPIVKAHFMPIAPIWKEQFGPDVLDSEVIVAGWSESRGPSAFALATSERNSLSGLPPWHPVDIGGAFLSPSDAKIAERFARLQLDFDDKLAVELIESQRAHRGVGGFVQLTTVNEHSIETRILRRWADEIGKSLRSSGEAA